MNELEIKEVDNRTVKRFVVFSVSFLFFLALVLFIYQSLLVPIGIGALCAYLFMPLVERLVKRGFPRWISVTVVVAVTVVLLVVVGIGIFPALYRQIVHIALRIPIALKFVQANWLPQLNDVLIQLGFSQVIDFNQFLTSDSMLSELQGFLRKGITEIWDTGLVLFGGAMNTALVPFISFFIMLENPSIIAGLRGLVPRDLLKPSRLFVRQFDLALKNVIKGQLTVAAVLGTMYVIGLSIVAGVFGLQSAVLIGVVSGFCRVVPYFDVIVGASMSAIVILSDFHGWGQVIGVSVVYAVVQAVDGMLITPRVIGERIGLHPVVVILSVFAFGNWFGLWGVLIVIPLIAVLKAFYSTTLPFYKASNLYSPKNSSGTAHGVSKNSE